MTRPRKIISTASGSERESALQNFPLATARGTDYFEEKIRAMAAKSLDAKRRFFELSSQDVARAARMIIECDARGR